MAGDCRGHVDEGAAGAALTLLQDRGLPRGSALKVGLYVLGWGEMSGGQLESDLLTDLRMRRGRGESRTCPPSIGLRPQSSCLAGDHFVTVELSW